MDGLHELTAAPVTLEIGGRTFRLSPLRVRDYGEIERRILLDRPKPLDVVLPRLAGLSIEQQRHLLELAYRGERSGERISLEELQQWLATVEGRLYRFWLMLRREQPQLTLDDAEELLLQVSASDDGQRSQAERAIESSSGLPVGNSGGQACRTAATSLAGPSPGKPFSCDSAPDIQD